MTTVVVSNLEVDKLLSSRMKVGAWFIQFLIAQRCGISICLWVRLFAWELVFISFSCVSG